MQKLIFQTCALSALACGIGSAQSSGLRFGVSANKTYVQVSPNKLEFVEGEFDMTMFDGIAFYDAGCPKNGSFSGPVGPGGSCSMGHTAVVYGDLNEDGNLEESGSFWSFFQPASAVAVAPGRESEVEIVAAPPSDLISQLPIGNAKDYSLTIFYNLQADANNGPTEYNITDYQLKRQYPDGLELPGVASERMRREIVPGVYTFSFPSLQAEFGQRLYVASAIFPFVDAYQPNTLYRYGFRYTKAGWLDGSVQLNSRIANKFTWTPPAGGTIAPRLDMLKSIMWQTPYFVDVDDDDIFEPFGDDEGQPADKTEKWVRFPVRELDRQFLFKDSTITSQSFVGNLFLFAGDTLTYSLNYDRFRPGGGVAFDTSQRYFDLPAAAMDTYGDYQSVAFPSGATKSKILPNADFDGDGVSNILEYALESRSIEGAFATFRHTGVVGPQAAGALTPAAMGPGVEGRALPVGERWIAGYRDEVDIYDILTTIGDQDFTLVSSGADDPLDAGTSIPPLFLPTNTGLSVVAPVVGRDNIQDVRNANNPLDPVTFAPVNPLTVVPQAVVAGNANELVFKVRPLMGTSLRHGFKIETAPGSGKFKKLKIDNVNWTLTETVVLEVGVTGTAVSLDAAAEPAKIYFYPMDVDVEVPQLTLTSLNATKAGCKVIYSPTYAPLK